MIRTSTCTDGLLSSRGRRVFNLRLGTTHDVSTLMKAAEQFYSTTNISKVIPFCPSSVARVIYKTIADGFIIIAERNGELVGVLGCEPTIYPFNTAYKGCVENMFWIGDAGRNSFLPVRMMRQAEECAKALGCDFLFMVRIPTSPEGTHEWYEKLGFVSTDAVYMKEV